MREPLIGESVRAKLRESAHNKGTYKNLELGRFYRFKSGQKVFQNYHRSEQTKRRLRILRKLTRSRLRKDK